MSSASLWFVSLISLAHPFKIYCSSFNFAARLMGENTRLVWIGNLRGAFLVIPPLDKLQHLP